MSGVQAPEPEDVKAFFDMRASRPLPHRYNRVNFDLMGTSPEEILERDRIEKRVVSRYMPVRPDDVVLDIGCGVGRWADEIVPRLGGGMYLGLDFSGKMLEIARERFRQAPSARFLHGGLEKLPELSGYGFNRININGVLEYVDDGTMMKCLEDSERLLAEGGFLYVKEPVAVKDRFCFDGYAEHLGMHYQAVYRSIPEYTAAFTDMFLVKRCELIACGPSWEQPYDAEKELCNMFWIIRKKGHSP